MHALLRAEVKPNSTQFQCVLRAVPIIFGRQRGPKPAGAPQGGGIHEWLWSFGRFRFESAGVFRRRVVS
jgi:hypothetical protein